MHACVRTQDIGAGVCGTPVAMCSSYFLGLLCFCFVVKLGRQRRLCERCSGGRPGRSLCLKFAQGAVHGTMMEKDRRCSPLL
eukprot:1155957-Pelagomonas_calceolata.AAC.1